MASDTKKAAKPKVKKVYAAAVVHTTKHGLSTYLCKTSRIATLKAAAIVFENIDEFLDDDGVSRDGIDCLESLLEGDYDGAIDIYAEYMADQGENLEIDPKVEIQEVANKFDKKELRAKLAEFMDIKKETKGGEEETQAQETQSEETKAGGGDDSSCEVEERHADSGGVSDRGDGSDPDGASQGTD